MLEPIVALLGEQLLRAELRRDQTEALLRHLVSQPVGVQRPRAQAAALGLALPDAYWPAVVAWHDGLPSPTELDGIVRAARRLVRGSAAVSVQDRLVLLHPAGAPAADVLGWVERVVALAQATAPARDVRAVAADHQVALGDLRDQVTRLARLCAHGAPAPRVTRARQHALEGLLSESVDPAEARRFVDDLLGALIAWDREHRSDLRRVLEAALDFPRHDLAAQRCFMHRNTFRHRLQRARDLLGEDLDDPQTRLAVHVALKLHRVAAGSDPARSDAASPRRERGSGPAGGDAASPRREPGSGPAGGDGASPRRKPRLGRATGADRLSAP
jgi:sugar diacid utilization regulator